MRVKLNVNYVNQDIIQIFMVNVLKQRCKIVQNYQMLVIVKFVEMKFQ